jgi:hypothetical protein
MLVLVGAQVLLYCVQSLTQRLYGLCNVEAVQVELPLAMGMKREQLRWQPCLGLQQRRPPLLCDSRTAIQCLF